MNTLIQIIESDQETVKNTSFFSVAEKYSISELAQALDELEEYRINTSNLYKKVRASIFLASGYKYITYSLASLQDNALVSFNTYEHILERRYEEAILLLRKEIEFDSLSPAVCSALSKAYHSLTFKTLANQVQKSVQNSLGNQWMFRLSYSEDIPHKIKPELLYKTSNNILYPVLSEETPVRMDLTHSAWSDIFFLGMDYPEGARVINVSIDLGVYKRDKRITPPIKTYLRVIEEPVIRLTSIDLGETKDINSLSELFNFGNDYLGLLKAAIISSGIIPPSFENTGQKLEDILKIIVGTGRGLEICTHVNDIPKGSRMAVSTNLLASIISCIMRSTGQTKNMTGTLTELERRLVASRAILGEWLGGSGGGWQDSGGVWPGIKTICGEIATEGDPEFSISKGCLLPRHHVIEKDEFNTDIGKDLNSSLIVFHGGMAQNVGPILEMVTEKYLLRSSTEWEGRQNGNELFDEILHQLKEGNIKELAKLIDQNWNGPLKTIIPSITSAYTETIIKKAKDSLGDNFWGFLMLGGMSGGGMGIFVNPTVMETFKEKFLNILLETKHEYENSLPFAMDPVIYNFSINNNGTYSKLNKNNEALFPPEYYHIQAKSFINHDADLINTFRKTEIDYYITNKINNENSYKLLQTFVNSIFKVSSGESQSEFDEQNTLTETIKKENGFDDRQHEELRRQIRKGNIALSRNRLPESTEIEDPKDSDLYTQSGNKVYINKGKGLIESGSVGVFSLAAGVGSRWTRGAGVIKAINPFAMISGTFKDFLEVHLLKTPKTIERYKADIPHIIATSYMTNSYIKKRLEALNSYGFSGKLYISKGQSIGQRFIPMERDLRFLFDEIKEEQLDEQKQKVKEAVRESLIKWACSCGEGEDYTQNKALQRLYPMGHWYEFSSMIRNGVLQNLLNQHKNLKYLMLHNIDTLGADLNEEMIGYHCDSGNDVTFEVISRLVEDRGGGLARVNGDLRIVEGLALPNEEDEFKLRFYNTMTSWISIDNVLDLFGLKRNDLSKDQTYLDDAVRSVSKKIPTYLTIKEVKYRWGNGQEDVFPVAQVEKLWSDIAVLPGIKTGYVKVDRFRGQQLKDPAQLDEWNNFGCRDYVANKITGK